MRTILLITASAVMLMGAAKPPTPDVTASPEVLAHSVETACFARTLDDAPKRPGENHQRIEGPGNISFAYDFPRAGDCTLNSSLPPDIARQVFDALIQARPESFTLAAKQPEPGLATVTNWFCSAPDRQPGYLIMTGYSKPGLGVNVSSISVMKTEIRPALCD